MAENYGTPPVHGPEDERLGVFAGKWHSEGQSYGNGKTEPWVSDEVTEWLPGQFFLVQREDARIGGDGSLITHALLGYDREAGQYVAHAFNNLGYHRRYAMSVDGRVWTLTGDLERARIEFSEDGRRQDVKWEWRPKGDAWVPLCDRTNVRKD